MSKPPWRPGHRATRVLDRVWVGTEFLTEATEMSVGTLVSWNLWALDVPSFQNLAGSVVCLKGGPHLPSPGIVCPESVHQELSDSRFMCTLPCIQVLFFFEPVSF